VETSQLSLTFRFIIRVMMSRGMAVAGMIILSALSGELSCMKFLRSNHFKINGTSNMPMLQNEDLASVNRVIEELGKGVKACDDLAATLWTASTAQSASQSA